MTTPFAKSIIEDFIEIYKGETCLWKVKSNEYHDRHLRTEAYKKLLEKLKELEPNAKKEDVKKINNLRSNVRKAKSKYQDSIKSGTSTDDVKKPTLWYYNLFDFLQDEVCKRKSVSNLDDDTPESNPMMAYKMAYKLPCNLSPTHENTKESELSVQEKFNQILESTRRGSTSPLEKDLNLPGDPLEIQSLLDMSEHSIEKDVHVQLVTTLHMITRSVIMQVSLSTYPSSLLTRPLFSLTNLNSVGIV